MKKKVFFPGEQIAIEEEYSAGNSAFEEDGLIKASIIGESVFNDDDREANVKGKLVEVAKEGDIVYGKVTTIKDSSAIVELLRADEKKVICNTRSQLPVRNVAKEYVTNIRDFYKTGDFIKAKISKVDKYSIDIATNETGLGVINAYCSKCKSALQFSNNKMMCITCGNVEDRKWFEKEDVQKERPRREFDKNNQGNFSRGNRFNNNRPNNRNFNGNRNYNKFSGRQNFRGGRR